MNETICPHCEKAFKVDEAEYANILKQMDDRKVEGQLNERLNQAEKDKIEAIKLVEMDSECAIQALKTERDISIDLLNSQIREKENSVQSAVYQAVREALREEKNKEQNIDVTNFEKELEEFKTGFSRNYHLAKRQFRSALIQIDKSITSLQKTREDMLDSEHNLELANEKGEDLSVKRLTRNNPTMAAKFAESKDTD
jgi:hypothetical protein